MRKVDKLAHDAFVNKRKFKSLNTKVEIEDGEAYLYLYGNLIAKTENGDVLINHCNWVTTTTQSRLSGFPVQLRRNNGSFIVNEKFIWKGGWLNLNHLD